MTNAELIDNIRRTLQQQKDQEHRVDLILARIQWLEARVKELEQERMAA